MHGLGNDFVVFDFTQNTHAVNPSITINTVIANLPFLANRKTGIGCDQILFIEHSNNPHANFNYRIFNADGSSANHCGNGARCVVYYLYRYHHLKQQSITLAIDNHIITGYKNLDNSISINMGVPQFDPQSLPFIHHQNPDNIYHLPSPNGAIKFSIASVGNPHVILQLPDISSLEDTKNLTATALSIQNCGLFPLGVNVNFYVMINRNNISLHTFERGCGFTDACGTGATATAGYAMAYKFINHRVTIKMPGGTLQLQMNKKGEMIMTGSAVEVFSGQLTL